MIRVALHGKEYTFSDLRAWVWNDGLEFLLDPLAKGWIPKIVSHKEDSSAFWGWLVEALQKQKKDIDEHEQRWLNLLITYRKKVYGFDLATHKRLSADEQAKRLLRLGMECAKILQQMAEGHPSPSPGCVSMLIDPVKFFLGQSRQVMVNDPRTGIHYPMGLKIKGEKEDAPPYLEDIFKEIVKMMGLDKIKEEISGNHNEVVEMKAESEDGDWYASYCRDPREVKPLGYEDRHEEQITIMHFLPFPRFVLPHRNREDIHIILDSGHSPFFSYMTHNPKYFLERFCTYLAIEPKDKTDEFLKTFAQKAKERTERPTIAKHIRLGLDLSMEKGKEAVKRDLLDLVGRLVLEA